MFKLGDKVKVVSCEAGVDKKYIGKFGTIDKYDPKNYYPYSIRFQQYFLNKEAKDFWWAEENLELFDGEFISQGESEIEDELCKIIITTTHNIEGYKIVKYIDIISYEYVIGTGPWSEFTSGIEDLFGQRSSVFEEKLSEARKVALDKIKEEAYIKNGNAVIGIDMEYTTFDANRVALIATGTVVRIESINI